MASQAQAAARKVQDDADDIETRVLTVVQELLADRTVASLKLPDVAKQARVGLDTIYRRWRTKADLVHAAASAQMRPVQAVEQLNERGSLRDRLVAGIVNGSRKIMTGRTGGVIRATVIEALSPDGEAWRKLLVEEQAERRAQTAQTVSKWRRRFQTYRIAGLTDAPRLGRPRTINDDKVSEVIQKTLQSKPTNATHWSTTLMAEETGLNAMAISRIWRAFGLKPHRLETFKLSTDPHFVEKVHDIVGLYLNPPDRAIVLCADEKSQIQALNRTQPALPLAGRKPIRLEISDAERAELEQWVRRRKTPAAEKFRAQIVLACAEGTSGTTIGRELGTTSSPPSHKP